jgi:hypothetical protein
MRLVCKDNSNPDLQHFLSIGKVYTTTIVDNISDSHYTIIDNTGEERPYKKVRFKTIQEIREEGFNQLGI